MEETQLPGATEKPGAPRTSLATRLTNVLVAPGEVFEEVKGSPPTPANWTLPLILATLMGIIYTFVIFSQPAVLQTMKENQEKRMQQQVLAGKMTQKQADAASDMTDRFMTPTMLKIFGSIGCIIANPAFLFLTAVVLWPIGRYGLHGSFSYMKAVEVVGLCLVISVLGVIISMLLAVIYGNPAMTPGPILLVGHFEQGNRLHALLSALNVVTLWYIGVLSVGLSRLSGASVVAAAVWLFGLWAVLTGGWIWFFAGRTG
jgi:hypothetical protein